MPAATSNPFGVRGTLALGPDRAVVYHLPALARQGLVQLDRLPFSIRILLENALRHAGRGRGLVTEDHVLEIAQWSATGTSASEIPFMPARVVLQDFTGVPCVVDLAAMRDAMKALGGDAKAINPLVPCDLVIDHSVQVDAYGSATALTINAQKEFERNGERYEFL